MRLEFSNNALEDMRELYRMDRRALDKLFRLLIEVKETPFTGTGKPEPLKHNHKGEWSRRITDEHRLIYMVEKDVVIILSCLSHYGDK